MATMATSTTASQSKFVDLHHITTPIASTQDEARRLLPSHGTADRAMAVLADIQLKGRGTHGRTWERGGLTPSDTTTPDGNLYVTVCVPMDKIPITITLLPLQVAVMVAQSIQSALGLPPSTDPPEAPSCPTDTTAPPPYVYVKWPNDVLINERKVSGTLIESESVMDSSKTASASTWFLIGIGINVASHPQQLSSAGRSAASLAEFKTPPTGLPSATAIGKQLAEDLASWVYEEPSDDDTTHESRRAAREATLLSTWRSMARLQEQHQASAAVVTYTIRDTGEVVTVQDVEPDGSLRVRGHNGTIRQLVAEYLV